MSHKHNLINVREVLVPTRNDNEVFSRVSDYIALVGRGQKSGKTFNQEQACQIMTLMLQNQTLPEQTGALLMLLRMREETDIELAGFLQACRNTLIPHFTDLPDIDLDLGCYAGKRRHLPWLLLAVMTLAQNGYKIFMHGLQENDSSRLYLDSVFEQLVWRQANSIEQAKAQLSLHNFTYISIKDIHPNMHKLLSMRHTLGLRSCMHTLAKMLNPASAKASLHGVFHRELDNTHINVAQILNETRVACIRGDSGEVEATPEKSFTMHAIDRDGKQVSRDFSVQLDSWSLQTRNRGVEALKRVWKGDLKCEYGEKASITTLAVMLATIESLESEDALKQAQIIWHHRDKNWPNLA